MNEKLKSTVIKKFENMTDEQGRQLLDYMEFLESKFNRSTRERSTLERIAENVEGTLRGNPLGEAAIKGTGGFIDAAGSVARGVAAAGQAAFDELQRAVGEYEKDEPKAGNTAVGNETDDTTGDGPTEEDPGDEEEHLVSDDNVSEGEAGGEKTSA